MASLVGSGLGMAGSIPGLIVLSGFSKSDEISFYLTQAGSDKQRSFRHRSVQCT